MTSLRRRAESGVRWSSLSQGGRQLVQLTTTVVLVRLLAPADFGLVGMAMVFVGLSALVHELGTAAAVVQRAQSSERLLSSVFWFNTACGLALAALLVALAPLVGRLYGEPRVVPLLQVLALTFVPAAAGLVPGALLQRELAFRALARAEVTALVVGGAAGITAAAAGLGAWSLIVQTGTVTTATAALLWVACPWRPRFQFDWRELRSIGGYGLGLTGFKVFNHFARNMDSVLIGRFLGATELGLYALAYRLMLYPLQTVSAVIARVMFPVYAKWQNDHAAFRRAFVKISAAVATISFPMMVGLAVVREPLVESILGPAWAPAAPLLLLLAPVGLMQSLISTLGGIYKATGRTGLFFAWGVGVGVIMIGAFLIGVRYGTMGVAAAYATATALAAGPSLVIPFRLIRLPMRPFLRALWPPLACSLGMGIIVAAVQLLLPAGLAAAATLAVLVAVGVLSYLGLSWLLNRRTVHDVLGVAVPHAA